MYTVIVNYEIDSDSDKSIKNIILPLQDPNLPWRRLRKRKIWSWDDRRLDCNPKNEREPLQQNIIRNLELNKNKLKN